MSENSPENAADGGGDDIAETAENPELDAMKVEEAVAETCEANESAAEFDAANLTAEALRNSRRSSPRSRINGIPTAPRRTTMPRFPAGPVPWDDQDEARIAQKTSIIQRTLWPFSTGLRICLRTDGGRGRIVTGHGWHEEAGGPRRNRQRRQRPDDDRRLLKPMLDPGSCPGGSDANRVTARSTPKNRSTDTRSRRMTGPCIAANQTIKVLPAPAETPVAADPAPSEETLLDEDALRDIVSEIVRQELQGALGERITRNVRKLVRREIHRALASQQLE